jgi:molybdopterin converting factor subunit 1
MTTNVRVRVLFFGAARDAVAGDQVEISLTPTTTGADALREIIDKHPNLRRFANSLLLAVNQEYVRGPIELKDGDELAVFPPVSGGSQETKAKEAGGVEDAGSGSDFFEVTTAELDVGAIARRVVLPECGATVTLDGYAREWTRGRRTLYLEYEAYEPMAIRELTRLGQRAHEKFDIAYIGIVHRTGRLEIGETSVVISVGAPHRRAAFEACEWAIRELKQTVPIWKKEVFEDGEVWVEGETG